MRGAHTPFDRTTVLNDVAAGYAAGVFSLETAVRMLEEAAYPIEDVAEEIERIQKRAFDQAARLADATGDNGTVREYLGLPKADPGVPPVPLVKVSHEYGQPVHHPAPSTQLPQSGRTGETGPTRPELRHGLTERLLPGRKGRGFKTRHPDSSPLCGCLQALGRCECGV
ncbi:hypothetical protein [Streptomyces sp. NPDC047009]|uniref:hypothetical protein n=1 Tax=Streptomyces sp. NPDC047009 TaxID=3154496 RepID=UPI00340FECAD